jgi:hypothetical protein
MGRALSARAISGITVKLIIKPPPANKEDFKNARLL